LQAAQSAKAEELSTDVTAKAAKRSLKRTATKKRVARSLTESSVESERDEAERMDIFTAVNRNDLENLREIVARDDQDVNERHPTSNLTALMIAASKGFKEALEILLEAKVGDEETLVCVVVVGTISYAVRLWCTRPTERLRLRKEKLPFYSPF